MDRARPVLYTLAMSVITRVILAFDLLEDEAAIMRAVDEFPGYRWRAVAMAPDSAVDGVFVAAFNYLQSEGFKNHLAGLPWEEPGHVQLLLCGEEESRFSLWEMVCDYRPLPAGQTTRDGGQWCEQSTREWRLIAHPFTPF